MPQIGIITSPGHNTEIESLRELKRVGLDAKIFRWNEDPKQIAKCQSFMIPGGFSYEDRGRSGLISAQNPVMDQISKEAAKGKPVIGICNGAQGLVELKLVPGDEDNTKALALAKNKRIKDGHVLGTGYYNEWVYVKRVVDKARTPFTHLVSDKPYLVPVAHGEGRYTSVYHKMEHLLEENQQVVFKYCDAKGNISDEFPVNPNGAMLNAAAVCNAEGNVLSIMPHPERGIQATIFEMFSSLKHHLEESPKLVSFPKLKLEVEDLSPKPYAPLGEEMVIEEIITDNEAYTLSNTLQKLLGKEVKLKRYTHFDIKGGDLKELEKTGELFNSNKESVVKKVPRTDNDFALLVQYREDFEGQALVENLNEHYDAGVEKITKGTLWVFEGVDEETKQKIIDSTLFYNINSQVGYDYL
jgi:phosphoribosylformylglycinamidine synthase